MTKVGFTDLLKSYNKFEFENLKLLTPKQKIDELFCQRKQPENYKKAAYDANQIYQPFKHESKKVKIIKVSQKKKQVEAEEDVNAQKKQKVYKPGAFALFYQINEGKFDKDAQVWYYKENKDIIGPVSSYNMDKMVYFKRIEQQTRVAFKGVQKFVKFSKIKKVIGSQKKIEV